jgi:hypothetical protein
MVGTRVQFSTILANINKKIYSYFWTKPAKYTCLVFVLCICNSNPMVGTRVPSSTILANANKQFILNFGLNLQNTPTLCLCCVFVIVTQWLGQEFDSQQFWQIPIIKILFLFLD